MTQASAESHEQVLPGANLRRLMARWGMTQADVVNATRLDERTVRSFIRGNSRPRARTLHKMANGLGVAVDELLHDPGLAAAFDRATNPAVAQVVDDHPQVFADWTPHEFDELFSRVAVGGELTEAGALAAAEAMNERRELMKQAAVVLESDQADLLREFVALLYRRATTLPDGETASEPR
jgi:transcriptional regulator with XRE-family HTH domain